MNIAGYLAIGVIIVLLTTGSLMTTANPVQVVIIDVYYESLCPYSREFIISQVYPTWKKLQQYMNITLIPIAKFQAKPHGGWNFTCQHGPDECLRNILQSCAMAHIPNHDTRMKYIDCLMNSSYPPNFGPQCAQTVGIEFENIKKCTEGREGEDLLHYNGKMAMSLNPPMTTVPWIMFNGHFSQKDRDEAINNMPAVVCHYLKPSPITCNHVPK